MVKYYVLVFFFTAILADALGQPVIRDCIVAQPLAQTVNYCSSDQQYTNANLSKSAWFQFTTTGFDVNITVGGAGAEGTLVVPQIRLFSDCSGTELVGSSVSSNNITSLYKGGLIIGNTYYIEVTGENDAMGTFKLCLNNYNPIVKPGQDCATSSFLCSTQTISQQNVSGAGLNNDEAKGTCLSTPGQVSESNSIWYKWQAANNGTLVFTITPSNTKDDIDWVLFDLGPSGDCANVNPANAIRCKAGYGIATPECPKDTPYYKTGLDFTDKDLTEPPGCGKGQNGKLKFITMVQGHVYGLLINNFSSGANGFTLAFTDQQGVTGTGAFVGPLAGIAYTGQSNCTASQPFTFTSTSAHYDSLKWSFGPGASIQTGTTPGPYVINYGTPGVKTVTLQAISKEGCIVVATQQVTVGIKPPPPVIQADKQQFCVNDTVRLQAQIAPGNTYSWTGPANFHTDSSVAVISITGSQAAGIYKLVINSYGCLSDSGSYSLPAPLPTPVAAFHTTPPAVNAMYGPVNIQFINDTFNADTFLWDFGDGATSTLKNPTHTYSQKGQFSVKLTASLSNACYSSATQSSVVIIQNNNFLSIPNTFTPNGDGINDLFNVTITNIKSYHIRIFDRWGSLLYESKDIGSSWNGIYQGKQAPFGVYYYIINAVGTDNAVLKRAGYVAVIR
ncbi:MAG TPA: gliding motility-associated C-terminal domain-containing protein [Mucilaginibacter sp.]|jgi:gliding motility-associated-like protein|nr:gliding motility-associated C-terminal domain-containing protein [Mucilaginibacter sp.]